MNNRSKQGFNLIRAIKKLFLSAFVVISFVAYALQNHSATGASPVGQSAGTPNGSVPPAASGDEGDSPAAPAPTITSAPSQLVFGPPPTLTPQASVPNTSAGQYKDGTYTGPEVDVNFGLVQVQAVVQNGRIANVQFLEYPSDRRTSVRINNVAVPELRQEAIQAQSANVNLITGATLTSEGFQMSLQAALEQARQ